MAEDLSKIQMQGEQPLQDTLVKVYRCAKVVKGGRNFSFAALVVVGDQNGTVGVGYGKAREVPMAVEKGVKNAKKELHDVPLVNGTIPHKVIGKFGSTQVVMIPAGPGTGVIAGLSARAVLEYAGVRNVLTKIYGSTSAKNVVKATLNGLLKLRDQETIQSMRGVQVEKVDKK